MAAVELVTIGQRHGLGLRGGGDPQYVVGVDVPAAEVHVGAATDLLVDEVRLDAIGWVGGPVQGHLLAQVSAHGNPRPCVVDGTVVRFDGPERMVAAGQSVVLYDADVVVGGGLSAG